MPKTVLTLGTFDGVHRGHQALLKKVVERAKACRAKSVALAFGMPPRHAGEVLAKPVLVTTLAEKIKILKALGIDRIQTLVFDRKTASTLPEDFFRDTILNTFNAVEMVVGPRVAFGKNRSGRLGLLQRLGKSNQVRIHVVSSIPGMGGAVSSRRIRAYLYRGNVEKANALLGYPYSVSGKVIHGDHRGRKLGFPTANIQVNPEKILPPGVFWVKVFPDRQMPFRSRDLSGGLDGLCNVGTRPTFTPHSNELHCETFIFGARGRSMYGRRLRIVFLRRIRREKRFRSAQALQRQVAKDLQMARLYKKGHFSI